MTSNDRVGAFELTSSSIIVMDPGYDIETTESPGLGCIVRNCRMGKWIVDVAWGEPETTGLVVTTATLRLAASSASNSCFEMFGR